MKNKGAVVVIDDDTRIFLSMAVPAESAGYTPLVFSSAEEFLKGGTAADAPCVVSDIGMRGKNGVELKQFIMREYPDVPVILVTGRHEHLDRYNIDTNDRLHLLEKPFDRSKLISTIKTLTGC
jgi:FixJ family two-component response regulator